MVQNENGRKGRVHFPWNSDIEADFSQRSFGCSLQRSRGLAFTLDIMGSTSLHSSMTLWVTTVDQSYTFLCPALNAIQSMYSLWKSLAPTLQALLSTDQGTQCFISSK